MRILIHSNREELDRNLEPVDYKKLPDLRRKWGGNIGNKLFLTAIDSYCHQEGVEYEYLTAEMSADYINNNFDLIIWPLANCFNASKEIMGYLNDYTQKLRRYRVPVLALGAGAQANSYDDLSDLAYAIKSPATSFIDAVHATGGTFGLRGYFTQELFSKLGYKDSLVIGCPSMYQMGKDLSIYKQSIKQEDIRLALNGDASSLKIYRKNNIYEKFPNSWFIDQGEYVFLLYDDVKTDLSIKEIRSLMSIHSYLGIEMLADGRVVCIYDLPRLASHIKELGINMSFGERIHGNILCTLLGIPSIVFYHDTRTKELAEFFEIPMFSSSDKKIDILEIYNNSSWNNFNKNFIKKYDVFEQLLEEYGMPKISTSKYTFLDNVDRYRMPEFCNDYHNIKNKLSRKILWIGQD